MRNQILIISLIALGAMTSPTWAQGSSAALETKIVTIRNLLESFADSVRPIIEQNETDISDILNRLRTIDSALSSHGRRISKLEKAKPVETPVSGGCSNKKVSWTVSGRTCSYNVPPVPEGVAYTISYDTTPTPTCGSRYVHGEKGKATYVCKDGKLVRKTGAPTVCMGTYSSHPDWGGDCR